VVIAPSEKDMILQDIDFAIFGGKVFLGAAEEDEAVICFTLSGESNQSWSFEKKIARRITQGATVTRREGAPFKEVKGLTITNRSKGPIELFVDTLGVTPVTIQEQDR
jgi:hypothetical protein